MLAVHANQRNRRIARVAALFVLGGIPALAEEDDVAAFEELTTRELKAAITVTEDQIYELFNELNSDDGFDMICKREIKTGSQFRRRVCKPKMLRDPDLVYEADAAFERPDEANKLIYSEQRQKMLDVAVENPELFELMVSRVRMLRIYNQRKREK